MRISADSPQAVRLATGLLILVTMLGTGSRFVHMTADFPSHLTSSGVLYTDEGWYSGNAQAYYKTGEWYRPGDLNFAVSLPVVQVFDYIAFRVFGFGIHALRLTTLSFLIGLLAVVWLLVREFEGALTAWLAVALLSTNHLLWAFSRLSLNEVPLTFFVALALLLAVHARGRWGPAFAAASGFTFILAMLTKTSAVSVLPLLMILILWREPSPRPRRINFVLFLATAGATEFAHWFLLLRHYPMDDLYFRSMNMGLNVDTSLLDWFRNGLEILDEGKDVDKILHRAFPVFFLLLLWRPAAARRDPLLWIAFSWCALYLGMFVTYGNFKPRYLTPAVAPLCIWAALTMRHLFTLGGYRITAALFGIILLLATGRNARFIGEYLSEAEYSFRDACLEMDRAISADPAANRVVMGHFSMTASLYIDITPVNNRWAPTSFAWRAEHYKPDWFSSEDYLWVSHWGQLRDRYEFELVVERDAFRNYRDYPMTLYRLRPRDPAAPMRIPQPRLSPPG